MLLLEGQRLLHTVPGRSKQAQLLLQWRWQGLQMLHMLVPSKNILCEHLQSRFDGCLYLGIG